MDPDHPSPVRDASVHSAARGTNKSSALQKDSVSWIGHSIKTGVPNSPAVGDRISISFFNQETEDVFPLKRKYIALTLLKKKSHSRDIQKIKDTLSTSY